MSKDLSYLIIKTEETVDSEHLAVGYLRYEVLRKMNPREFRELWDKNMKGRNFDSLVDELIVKD